MIILTGIAVAAVIGIAIKAGDKVALKITEARSH